MFLVRKRIRVSAHQALLVFRRGLPARVTLNDTVVLPFWEEVEFIELKNFILKWNFSDENSLYTKNLQRMDISLELELSIQREPKKILSLAKEFSTETIHDAEKIQEIFTPELKQTLTSFLMEKDAFEWIYQRAELVKKLDKQLSYF